MLCGEKGLREKGLRERGLRHRSESGRKGCHGFGWSTLVGSLIESLIEIGGLLLGGIGGSSCCGSQSPSPRSRFSSRYRLSARSCCRSNSCCSSSSRSRSRVLSFSDSCATVHTSSPQHGASSGRSFQPNSSGRCSSCSCSSCCSRCLFSLPHVVINLFERHVSPPFLNEQESSNNEGVGLAIRSSRTDLC